LIANALGVKPKEKTEEEKEIDRKKFEEARGILNNINNNIIFIYLLLYNNK